MQFIMRHRWILTLGLLAGLWFPQAQAAEPQSSLEWVPADAGYYSCWMRNREQFDAVKNSAAWKRFAALKLVKLATDTMAEEWQADPDLAEMIEYFSRPEGQMRLSLLGEMVSDEIFIYGDNNLNNIQRLQSIMQVRQMTALFKQLAAGGFDADALDPDADQQATIRAMFSAVHEHPELLKMPVLVMGFKIRDTASARKQVEELHTLLAGKLEPPWKSKLVKKQVAGMELHAFTFDAKTIGLFELFENEADLDAAKIPAAQIEAVRKTVNSITLSINIALRDNYLLLSMGPDTKHLENLGKQPLLRDTADFKPLAAAAGKRLASVHYMSRSYRLATISSVDWQGMYQGFLTVLQNADLPPDLVKRIKADTDELAEEAQATIGQLGSLVHYSVLNDTGWESYSYDSTQAGILDASRPLSMLSHLGGQPFFASVWRSGQAGEYEVMVKWLGKLRGYWNDFGVTQLDPDQQMLYARFEAAVMPLLKRFDKITREDLLPALADGQGGFLLGTASPLDDLGVPAKALEPAMLFGVSDTGRLTKAIAGYARIVEDASAALEEVTGGEIPAITIPPPLTRTTDNGTLYYYPVPGMPNENFGFYTGLSKDTAVVAMSAAQTEKLLKSQPLVPRVKLDGLGEANSYVTVLDWRGMVSEYEQVLMMGWSIAMANVDPLDQDPASQAVADLTPEELQEHMQATLGLFKAFHGYTSRTYKAGGKTVTHGRTQFGP